MVVAVVVGAMKMARMMGRSRHKRSSGIVDVGLVKILDWVVDMGINIDLNYGKGGLWTGEMGCKWKYSSLRLKWLTKVLNFFFLAWMILSILEVELRQDPGGVKRWNGSKTAHT